MTGKKHLDTKMIEVLNDIKPFQAREGIRTENILLHLGLFVIP